MSTNLKSARSKDATLANVITNRFNPYSEVYRRSRFGSPFPHQVYHGEPVTTRNAAQPDNVTQMVENTGSVFNQLSHSELSRERRMLDYCHGQAIHNLQFKSEAITIVSDVYEQLVAAYDKRLGQV